MYSGSSHAYVCIHTYLSTYVDLKCVSEDESEFYVARRLYIEYRCVQAKAMYNRYLDTHGFRYLDTCVLMILFV